MGYAKSGDSAMKKSASWFASLVLAATMGAGISTAMNAGAASSPAPVTYYACDKGGTLSLVATHPSTCPARATRVTWNQVGPAGPQGARGLAGVTGAAGAVGPQGLQGIQGLKGDAGATGLQGIQGQTGTTGTSGQRGSVWSTGASAPAYIAGEVSGDTYLDTTTGDVYQFTGATWVKVGNIQGPIGATGVQGNQGIQGIQGLQGVAGPQGTQGVAGPTGSQGPSGLSLPSGSAFVNGYLIMKDAYLVDADLSGQNLSGLRLDHADLINANVSGANFSGTNLTDANFTGANTSGAIYSTDTVCPNGINYGTSGANCP